MDGSDVVSVALHVPAWMANGVVVTRPAFLSFAVADVLIEQVALGIVLLVALRLFGGQVPGRPFVPAFCLLSALQLVADACLVPVQTRAIAAQGHDFGEFLERVGALGDAASLAELGLVIVAGAASLGFRIAFLVALLRAFHLVEQLGRVKAAATLALAIALWLVSVLIVSRPLQALLYQAFGRPS